MNYKKIFGITLIVCGVILLGGAAYVHTLLEEGKGQIADAQKKVEDATVLLGIHPLSRRLSKNAEEKAQGKIDEATATVEAYEEIVQYSLYGGGFLVIVGTTLLIYSRKKKR